MQEIQKWGGFAAIYMAIAYIIGIVIFIFILDYPHIVEPSQKVALLKQMSRTMFLTNIFMYVFFGLALILFTVAIHERFKTLAPYSMKVASIIGFIWAGSLIASGMISNGGIDTAITLYDKNPLDAERYWICVETVTNGLSYVNGEILGGIFTLLISLAAIREKRFSRIVIGIGCIVGFIGVVSTIPGFKDLTGLFGIAQIVWFVWFGIMLMTQANTKAMNSILKFTDTHTKDPHEKTTEHI